MTQRDWLPVAVAYGLGHVAATPLVLANRAAPYVFFDKVTVPPAGDGAILVLFALLGIVVAVLWGGAAQLAYRAPVVLVACAFALVPLITGYMHVALPHTFSSITDITRADSAMELLRWSGVWSFLAAVIGGLGGHYARAWLDPAPQVRRSRIRVVLPVSAAVVLAFLAFDAVFPRLRDAFIVSTSELSRNDAVAIGLILGVVLNGIIHLRMRRAVCATFAYAWIAGALCAGAYWSFRNPYLFYGDVMAWRGIVFAGTALACYLFVYAEPPVHLPASRRFAFGFFAMLIVIWVGYQEIAPSIASRIPTRYASLARPYVYTMVGGNMLNVPVPLYPLTTPVFTAAALAGLLSRTRWLAPFYPRLNALLLAAFFYVNVIWAPVVAEYQVDLAEIGSPSRVALAVAGSVIGAFACFAAATAAARLLTLAGDRLGFTAR